MSLINRCPHVRISGIYGDEINHCGGYRLSCDDCGRLLDGAVSLAKPAPHIIRSLEELEEFDEETVFMNIWSDLFDVSNVHAGMNREDFPYYFPCAVVASGEQVRAAREAMEEDNG